MHKNLISSGNKRCRRNRTSLADSLEGAQVTKGSLHLRHSTSLRFLSAAPPKNPGKLTPELFRQQLSKDKLYKCSRKIRKTILWVLISGQRIPRTLRSSSLGLEVRAFQKLIHKAESSQFSSEASKCFRKWRIVRKKKTPLIHTHTCAYTHNGDTQLTPWFPGAKWPPPCDPAHTTAGSTRCPPPHPIHRSQQQAPGLLFFFKKFPVSTRSYSCSVQGKIIIIIIIN